MLTYIYAVSFLISLSGLIAWFYVKENPTQSRLMSQLFLGGFFIYLFSLAFSDTTFSTKLLVLARDLVVLGCVSQFFNFFRKRKIIFFSLIVLLYGIVYVKYWEVLTESFVVEHTFEEEEDDEGEFLVEVRNDVLKSDFQSIINEYDLFFERAFPDIKDAGQTDLDNYFLINIPEKNEDKAEEIRQKLMDSGLIDDLEINDLIQISPLKGKVRTLRKSRYGVNDPSIDQLWGFEQMNVRGLYDYIGENSIKPIRKAFIVILDTGVDAEHEDIAANYKSIDKKYDKDENNHGTHCAGIAAAVSNNGKGIASFSPRNQFVQVGSVQVLSKGGSGTQRGIINGIIKAADNGADVISMSLGGPSNDTRQRAYEKAVKYANDKGAIVIVAAGNSNVNAKNYGPANTPGVITVSAVDDKLNKAVFSNWVTDVERGIAAPGVNIYSTIPNNQYASYNGTSMATPYVAGLVGLMKAINPALTTAEAYQLLENTGVDTQATEKTGKFVQPLGAIKSMTN